MSQTSLIPTGSQSPIFSFKSYEIRTIMQDGQPWFVARDVCAALGIGWTGRTLSQIPGDWQCVCKLHIRRGMYETRVISEPAVYKLAFRSNKPEADEFTNWVASEVLPAIRKTGKYESEPKTLPAGNPQHLFDRLGLSPYEKVLMGPQVRAMLDNEEEVGPRTLECVLLKARYIKVIDEVYRLSQSLAADLRRTSLAGQIMQTVNKSRDFSDPFIETLTADEYLISQMGRNFHSTAFRALNNNICMAKMLGA